jgi:hypothetical protein
MLICHLLLITSCRPDQTMVAGDTIPTYEQMLVLMKKTPSMDDLAVPPQPVPPQQQPPDQGDLHATETEITHFVVYLFGLMPVFNKPWKKAIEKMTKTNKPVSAKTVERCIKGCDHALLMQTLKHHRSKWILDIQENRPRTKGQSSGARKMAHDNKSYNTGGNLGIAWMKSDLWKAWMKKGLIRHEPDLELQLDDEVDDFAAASDSEDSDEEEIKIW